MDKFSFSEMRMWDQFKITSYCFCVWCESREIGGRGSSTFPCVTQVLETSTLDRATLRTLPNNNNEVPLQKQAMVLTRWLPPQKAPQQTFDQIPNADSTRCAVNVDCGWTASAVTTGWCTRKWLRLDQTIRNLTSGDLGIWNWIGPGLCIS